MGLHAGLHAGGLLHLLGLAAVILDLIPVLHNRLVAAPPQSHVDGGPGVLIVLSVGLPVHTDSDAQGHRHIVADIYSLYILQDGEMLLLHLQHVLPLHHKEVFVLFQLLYNALQAPDVLVDLPVNQGDQEGSPNLLHALQCLVIIIQVNQSGHQLLIIHLLPVL